jgi:xanthine dehydrogenase accessory factor
MQGHHDEEAVNQALLAGPAYIGLVRPRPRAKSVFEYLESPGLSNKALVGGKVSVGLDVGRVSLRKIPVGVLAELVRLRAGGELVRGARPERPEIVHAIDPVCGVTVDVESARHKVDHEGATYYFCCPGCARGHWRRTPPAFIRSGTKS